MVLDLEGRVWLEKKAPASEGGCYKGGKAMFRGHPSSSGQTLKVAATMEAELAEGFFGAEIEGHQDLYSDATAAVVEFVDADDFA